MMDGGVQRGTHILKALSIGARAVGIGRYYLFPLAVGGQEGVELALELLRTEIDRDADGLRQDQPTFPSKFAISLVLRR